MTEKFFAFFHSIGLFVASIVMLIVVAGGITVYLKMEGSSNSTVQAPTVKFSNFEAFKNFSAQKNVSTNKEDREQFQKVFFESFPTILKNISDYAQATNQLAVNNKAFEKQLFMLVSQYDHAMKISYLEQLSVEVKNLLAYSETVKNDATKKTILWTNFLNWFTRDFEDQLQANKELANSNVSQSITIEASLLTQVVAVGILLVVVMLFIMMLLLLRRDTKLRPAVAIKEVPETK